MYTYTRIYIHIYVCIHGIQSMGPCSNRTSRALVHPLKAVCICVFVRVFIFVLCVYADVCGCAREEESVCVRVSVYAREKEYV